MKPARQHGFTLVETVISLVLLSFLVLIGYQGLAFGLDQWRIGDRRMRHSYDYYQALGWMRDRLGSAELAIRAAGDGNDYLFDGGPQGVEFVTGFDRARGGGLYVVRIYLDRDDHKLYTSYRLHHPDTAQDPNASNPDRTVLLDEVAAARFTYYGRQPGSNRKGWQDTWPGQDSLPQLLRLEIETLDGVLQRSLLYLQTSNNV